MTVSSGEPGKGEILFFGPFRLVVAERLLVKDGVPVGMGGRALDILIALVARAGEIVTRRELIDLVWPATHVEKANLRVQVAAVRKALADGEGGSRYIVNVPGRGYTFVAPVKRSDVRRAAAPTQPRPQELPNPPQHLIGRSDTVAALSSLLAERRFLSVVGPGGIGKTTVAIAVANAMLLDFGNDSICFVDLGALADPLVLTGAVASALGCSIQGPDPESSILAFLADRKVLIVLDSCEHLLDAVASLAERLFQSAPSAYLLATSREALRVEGENVHLLTPLDCPAGPSPSAAEALASPAVQLFMAKAAASGYRTELSDAEAAIVADICRRLDGMALAIELVASRVGTFGIKGVTDLLNNGAELMLLGRRSVSPRHQTLQAMLDWSYRLLSEHEQKILCRLSVFVGQSPLEAMPNVVGEADGLPQAIASLADKSLLQISANTGSTYLRLLDTTRAYAAARLAERGETDAIALHHARYFANFLRAQETPELQLRGRDAVAYARHMGNIRQALTWSFSASGDPRIGVELAAHAAPLFLSDFSLLSECGNWCRKALAVLEEADRGTQRELELQKALALSSMYLWRNIEEIGVAIERALEISENAQDERNQHHLLMTQNVYLQRCGDFGGALTVATRSAEMAQKTGSISEKILTQCTLGASLHLAGNQAAALHHCELGFKLASEVSPTQLKVFGYDYKLSGMPYLARSLWLCGFPDRGSRVAREGLTMLNDVRHPLLYGSILLASIPVLLWSGDDEGAMERAEHAIAYASKYSLHAHHAAGLALKGEAAVAAGDAISGVEILREAMKAMEGSQYHLMAFQAWRALADGLALSGRPEEALAAVDEAIVRAANAGATLWQAELLRTQGEILLAHPRRDLAAAEVAMRRALESAKRQSALSWELKAAITLARLLSEQGKVDAARSMLKPVYQRFTEGLGTRDLDTARRLLGRLRP